MLKISIKLFKGKTLKKGDHPFVIQLSMDRKTRRISLGYSCQENVWNDKSGEFRYNNAVVKKNRKYYQDLQSKLNDKLYEFRQFVMEFEKKKAIYSLDEIVDAIRNKDTKHDYYTYTDGIIASLMKREKIGNAKVYKDTLKAVKRYHGNGELLFNSIDFKFLSTMQDFWSLTAGESTISMYMRTIRAVFNKAINDGLITSDIYPFKKYKISNLDTSTTPRPLLEDELNAIRKQETDPGSQEEFAKDIFFFSFYNMGMNFTDIAYLTWDNVYDERIHYIRKKVRSTSKKTVSFSIKILPEAQLILDKYKGLRIPGGYIFPVFNGDIHKNEIQKFNRKKKVLRHVNKALKNLAETAEIDLPVTMYYARHSWANLMKNKRVSTEHIKEGMGHDNINTTEIYLNSFSNDTIDDINQLAILKDDDEK